MLRLPRIPRALLPCALVALAVAIPAHPAQAADASASVLPCVQTGVLPDLGSCPAPAQDPAPAPTQETEPQTQPEKPATRSKKGGCANSGLTPTARNGKQIRAAILCLLNKERTRRGRSKLRAQATLQGVAERYAAQMVDEGFFDHVSPAGTTMLARIKSTSYLSGQLLRWSVGENLAWGTGRLATPAKIMSAWMKSPGHKRNILDRTYREVGVGMVLGAPTDASRGATYVTEFGRRIRR